MPTPTGKRVKWYQVRVRTDLRRQLKSLADRERRSVAMMTAILLERALADYAAERR